MMKLNKNLRLVDREHNLIHVAVDGAKHKTTVCEINERNVKEDAEEPSLGRALDVTKLFFTPVFAEQCLRKVKAGTPVTCLACSAKVGLLDKYVKHVDSVNDD